MSFKVILLGTGAAVPTLKRGTTAQFVQIDQRRILIDCGEGTQLKLRKANIKFQNLHLILISHLHGDHILGLPGLISTMQLLGRKHKLNIVGPIGIREYVLFQFKLMKVPRTFPIEFYELSKGAVEKVYEDKCIYIQTFPLKHRIATQGYKISEQVGKRILNKEAFDKTGVSVAYINKLKEGLDIEDNNGTIVQSKDVTFPPKPTKSYAFCSDTAFNRAIIQHIKGVDLLYHEATFLEKEKKRAHTTYHSTAKEAALIAKEAGAKQLLIGHFSARYKVKDAHLNEAQEIFKNTQAPEDGEIFIIR